MISRDKVFIVADNVDDTIQSQITAYEIKIFRTFVDFEQYVNDNPVVVDSVVITEKTLPFTGQNIARVVQVMQSPFFKMIGSMLYLIGEDTSLEKVNSLLDTRDIKSWVVYQGDLSMHFIVDIIIGNGRNTTEGLNEVITYRVRAADYIRQQNQLKYKSNENKYLTDEDLLSGIPNIEEPEEINPSQETALDVNYIVGDLCMERSLIVFLLSQYFSMSERTLVVEKDVDYHMLGEMFTKSGLDFEFVAIEDLYKDVDYVLNQIRGSSKKLVYVGTKQRRHYDYTFVMDILESNLKSSFRHIIKECDFDETPYGRYYTIVTANTVPTVLKCCNSLKYDVDPELATFIGVQSSNLGAINITSNEMKAIAEVVLSKNGINAQVVHTNGLLLKGDKAVYDIFGILNRSNRR